MRNKTKRLGALGATALVALVVIGSSGVAQAATTTTVAGGSTTTTTLPPQKSVHGSTNNINNCQSALNPPIQPGGPDKIGVTISSDAFPQPHEGDPIKLTNTKVSISIPASLLQVGVSVGIIFDGQQIPSTLTLVVAGSNTTQKTHKYVASSTVTVHVIGGQAQPLTSTLNLPNFTWTPTSKFDPCRSPRSRWSSSRRSTSRTSSGSSLFATFTCKPAGTVDFMDIGGLTAPATTTTVTTTTTTIAPTTVAPTVAPAATTANQLPRTGSQTGWLLALAVVLLSLGLFVVRASGFRPTRSRP